jgi:hypothetical protein
MLARNGDIQGVVKSIKQMEDRFNKRFRYPYVFLNEQPFSDVFIEYVYPSHRGVLYPTHRRRHSTRQESNPTNRFSGRVWTYSSGPLASARLDRRGTSIRGTSEDGGK